MTHKKEPLDISDMDATPVTEEDKAGPDNALMSQVEKDSNAQVPEQDSDARDDAVPDKEGPDNAPKDSDAQVHDNLQSPDWMEGLTPEVRMRVQRVKEIEFEYYELEKKLDEEREALYTERSKIVNGEVDVGSNIDETAEEATSDEKATQVNGIPDFWLTAMKNDKDLAKKIKRRDEEALKYLKDIQCHTFDAPSKLTLDFHFDNNPFFSNSILTRTYTNKDKYVEITSGPSTGTVINWLSEKRLTHKFTKYKPIEGHGKRKNKTKKCDSFFDFFGDEKYEEGIGCILVGLIPNAASWYTGEALQEILDESEKNEGDGEASNKRTRVEGPTARKPR